MYALTILIGLILSVATAEAQVNCAQYGNHFYCIGPNGNTTQTDLGNGMGVIQSDRALTPYAVLPGSRPSSSRGFDPRGGLQPLPSLPSLPTLNYGTPAMPALPSLAPPPIAEPFSSGPLFFGTP